MTPFTIQEVSSHSPQERMFQMLTDISEQCTPGEKENIENFLNMYQMLSAYDTLFSLISSLYHLLFYGSLSTR